MAGALMAGIPAFALLSFYYFRFKRPVQKVIFPAYFYTFENAHHFIHLNQLLFEKVLLRRCLHLHHFFLILR